MKDAIRALTGFRLGQFQQYAPRSLVPRAPATRPRVENAPVISLVTPVRNQAAYIRQTMESVFNQNYAALEYIVMDGDSNDGTKEIIESYRHRLAHFESAPDGGQSDAINKGLAKASGDILGWLNADDLLLPGAIDEVSRFFAENPDIDVVYGNRIIIDDQGCDIGRWILPPHSNRIISWIDYVPQETLFWRRGVWEKVGGRVDDTFHFAMDWDLLVRFRECGARFFHIPKFLGAFRVHAEQKTSALMHSTGIDEMNRIRKRCLGHVPSRVQIGLAATPYITKHIFQNLYFHLREMAAR